MSGHSERAKRLPYFLPAELVLHCTAEDCWYSCFGRVYELSEYVARSPESPMRQYLLAHAGRDVSHWFDAPSQRCGCSAQLRRYVEPATGRRRIVLPYNNPIPEGAHSTFMSEECGCSWHADGSSGNASLQGSPELVELTGKCWLELEYILNGSDYQRGWLTKKPRPCSITNVLTGQRAIISVCEEDSIERIQERASIFNSASYTWKFEGKLLDPRLTLTENGIPDERDRYLACGLPDDRTTYLPNLLCYFNDDLTEA